MFRKGLYVLLVIAILAGIVPVTTVQAQGCAPCQSAWAAKAGYPGGFPTGYVNSNGGSVCCNGQWVPVGTCKCSATQPAPVQVQPAPAPVPAAPAARPQQPAPAPAQPAQQPNPAPCGFLARLFGLCNESPARPQQQSAPVQSPPAVQPKPQAQPAPWPKAVQTVIPEPTAGIEIIYFKDVSSMSGIGFVGVVALQSTAKFAPLMLVDGPLPIGDVAAVVLIGGTVAYAIVTVAGPYVQEWVHKTQLSGWALARAYPPLPVPIPGHPEPAHLNDGLRTIERTYLWRDTMTLVENGVPPDWCGQRVNVDGTVDWLFGWFGKRAIVNLLTGGKWIESPDRWLILRPSNFNTSTAINDARRSGTMLQEFTPGKCPPGGPHGLMPAF